MVLPQFARHVLRARHRRRRHRGIPRLQGRLTASSAKRHSASDREKLLVNHYKQNIVPKLLDEDGKEPPLEEIFPREPAALELQSLYITENPNPIGEKDKLVDHPVANPYTIAHAKHHPWLRNLMSEAQSLRHHARRWRNRRHDLFGGQGNRLRHQSHQGNYRQDASWQAGARRARSAQARRRQDDRLRLLPRRPTISRKPSWPCRFSPIRNFSAFSSRSFRPMASTSSFTTAAIGTRAGSARRAAHISPASTTGACARTHARCSKIPTHIIKQARGCRRLRSGHGRPHQAR